MKVQVYNNQLYILDKNAGVFRFTNFDPESNTYSWERYTIENRKFNSFNVHDDQEEDF